MCVLADERELKHKTGTGLLPILSANPNQSLMLLLCMCFSMNVHVFRCQSMPIGHIVRRINPDILKVQYVLVL